MDLQARIKRLDEIWHGLSKESELAAASQLTPDEQRDYCHALNRIAFEVMGAIAVLEAAQKRCRTG